MCFTLFPVCVLCKANQLLANLTFSRQMWKWCRPVTNIYWWRCAGGADPHGTPFASMSTEINCIYKKLKSCYLKGRHWFCPVDFISRSRDELIECGKQNVTTWQPPVSYMKKSVISIERCDLFYKKWWTLLIVWASGLRQRANGCRVGRQIRAQLYELH